MRLNKTSGYLEVTLKSCTGERGYLFSSFLLFNVFNCKVHLLHTHTPQVQAENPRGPSQPAGETRGEGEEEGSLTVGRRAQKKMKGNGRAG